jgi:DNA primase large subunit
VSQTHQTRNTDSNAIDSGRSENLRDSPMMAHLLDALNDGTDIGHYGRLTFVMIARHFLNEDEIVKLLSKQPDHNETEARALMQQVKARDYNPPKRERILQWQGSRISPSVPHLMNLALAMYTPNCVSHPIYTKTSTSSGKSAPKQRIVVTEYIRTVLQHSTGTE